MPYAPFNSLCREFGCKQPRSKLNSFCIDHGGKNHSGTGDSNVYSDPAWRTIRRGQLSKQPLCQSCLCKGHVSSAVHVDHIFPWRQIGQHAFLNNIFQSLCHECHSYKTGQERKGTFIHYIGDEEKIFSIADYGYTMTQWQSGQIV